MGPSVVALVGYIAWMIVLLSMIGLLRVGLTFTGKRAPNSFAPDGADISPFSNRVCRAHANCYESFPIFGGLLLLALATDASNITDSLALYVLGARILQSLAHLASTSNMLVMIRFTFFLVQVLIGAWWVLQFIQAG